MNGKRPGGWVALACRYFRDPRFDDVSADAELLWCHALAYCGEQETDGHIGRGQLVGLSQRLSGSPAHAAGELVAAGLWVATGRGYAFPRWSDWQPTADQAERSRAREAERKARQRTSPRGDTPSDNGVSPNGSPGGSRSASGAGAGVGHSPTTPDPRRHASPGGGQSPEWEEVVDDDGAFLGVRFHDAGDL